jgi:flagellin
LTARTYALKANDSMTKAMERLASGLRINSAADDAAGLAVANKMESQLRGMNIAIRNSQDGISLVQTAEAGMSEISNMLIRMRELAVQMNNGIYTTSDRSNAQLEVDALLLEVDKIANNTAFNDVKVLDGTYSADIRAGNTNVELINVTVDRMNTDSLGGVNLAGTTVTATSTDSTAANSVGTTVVSAQMANEITVQTSGFGQGLQDFVAANAGGTYTFGGDDESFFNFTNNAIVSKNAIAYDTSASPKNTYNVQVTYTAGANSYTDNIAINITPNTTSSVIKSSSTTMTTTESASVSFRSTNSAGASDGVLSNALQAFVDADSGAGTYTVTGTDGALFDINASNGVITAALDWEVKQDSGTNNVYDFDVTYTSSTGDKFVETVALTVTNSQEEIITYDTTAANAGGNVTFNTSVTRKDQFVAVVDGKTITAEVGADDASFTLAKLATLLNNENAQQTDLNQARGTFRVDPNTATNLQFVFNDDVGDIDIGASGNDITQVDKEVQSAGVSTGPTTPAVPGADAVARVGTYTGIGASLNSAATGDIFDVTIAGVKIEATVGAGVVAGQYGVASLVSDLNAANQAKATPVDVTFSANGGDLLATVGTANSALAMSSALNRTPSGGSVGAVGTVSVTTNESPAAARTADFDIALPAAVSIGDKFEVTINGTTYTSDALAAATVVDIAAKFNSAYGSDIGGYVASTALGGAGGNTQLVFTALTAGAAANNDTFADYTLVDVDNAAAYVQVQANGDLTNTDGVDTLVSAAASNSSTGGRDNSSTGSNEDGEPTNILNGTFTSSVSSFVTTAKTAVSINEGSKLEIGTDAMSAALNTYRTSAEKTGGTFTLSGTDASKFSIDKTSGLVKNVSDMDADTDNTHSFNVVYTDKNGGVFTEEVTLTLQNNSADDGSHLANVDLTSQGSSETAIAILDVAINQIASAQAKLGAVQNRLQHNIDNLSAASMLTETAKGRIVDADFARETTELSKQQILGQAATSMLAQANQSKQSVLALLQ